MGALRLEFTSTPPATATPSKPTIWWSNSIFFVSIHLAAALGICLYPPSVVSTPSLVLGFAIWQMADFGITIGYHRLYSHRAFKASLATRTALAALGSAAFQGSIKWWCLRHRLHHRFTDDPIHDPYSATRGLFYSHMGWIFYKPSYERMELIDKRDLESDPVVRFQHKYYVILALFFGFVVPPMLGMIWNDPTGAFVYGGLVSRLFIWHCTFLVNSLAHWDGLQPYSDENTSRGNLILALLTGGEGNHNFHHAFPHDFRSGPSLLDWDPSKWIIIGLHALGLASSLRRARPEDMVEAIQHMQSKHDQYHGSYTADEQEWTGPEWTLEQIHAFTKTAGRCVLLIDGFVIDATPYLREHPGGAAILRQYATRDDEWFDASYAFNRGLNNHSRAARRRMAELRIARILEQST